MILREQIKDMVLEALKEQPQLFLVDIENGEAPSSFRFLVDGDSGIGIHDCAMLSRSVSKMIDESNLSDQPFTFEISSPGADRPLLLPRQYPKHVGRTLEVMLQDGMAVTGILRTVSENGIILEEKANKKPKKGETPAIREIAFGQIKQSRIIITFK